MSIMLGNLTVKEIETRAGIEFPKELVEFMNETHQAKAEKIEAGRWHCFDIPFTLVCGDMPTAQKIFDYLKDFSSDFKQPLSIALA